MAPYPSYTIDDLADFSGRPASSYNDCASDTMIAQATFLFKMSTCLAQWPDDPDQAQLAEYAVLSMADALVLNQKYQAAASSPFISETIGSYSYSKRDGQQTAQLLSLGRPTDIFWFDLAVQKLGVCEDIPGVAGDSISVMEFKALFAVDDEGHKRFVGPEDIDPIAIPPFSFSVPSVTYDPNG